MAKRLVRFLDSHALNVQSLADFQKQGLAQSPHCATQKRAPVSKPDEDEKFMAFLSSIEKFRSILAVLCILTPSTSFAEMPGDPEKRLEAAAVGAFISLKQMFDEQYTTACIVPPYANKIKYRPDVDAIVNRYLSNSNYQGGERYWSLVLVNDVKVTLVTFDRSSKLDLFSPSDFSRVPASEAANFSALNCTSFKDGGFLKVSFSNRNYVVLGERK